MANYTYTVKDGSSLKVNRWTIAVYQDGQGPVIDETLPNSTTLSETDAVNAIKTQYSGSRPGIESMTKVSTPNTPAPTPAPTPSQPQTNTTPADVIPPLDPNVPDLRLMFAIDDKTGAVAYSMSSLNEHPLVDGMVFSTAKSAAEAKTAPKVVGQQLSDDDAFRIARDFYGVPSLMNPNSYINLQGAGGRVNNKYLIERENQIRWYNATEPGYGDGSGVQPSSAPTVSEIIKWSQTETNVYKFPYQTVTEQNRRIQQTPQPPALRVENVSGPYNDYWVSDNDMKDENNAYRFRIDNAILDPSKKKLYFQKYV
jgi:hypothetical protein